VGGVVVFGYSMSDGSVLQNENELKDLISRIWSSVVFEVNRLLETHRQFGFVQFSKNLNPTLADVITGFQFIDFALEKLLESGKLDYDETRIALNSRQCFLKMQELSAACDNNRQDDYDRVIADLQKQSPV
jgi:hypothetical protein